MTDKKFLERLKKKLTTSTNYSIPYPKESIMDYERVCSHDSGFLCEHRLEWILNEVTKHLEGKKK